jgi:hypothetical protein
MYWNLLNASNTPDVLSVLFVMPYRAVNNLTFFRVSQRTQQDERTFCFGSFSLKSPSNSDIAFYSGHIISVLLNRNLDGISLPIIMEFIRRHNEQLSSTARIEWCGDQPRVRPR